MKVSLQSLCGFKIHNGLRRRDSQIDYVFLSRLVSAVLNNVCDALGFLVVWTSHRPQETVPTTEASDY